MTKKNRITKITHNKIVIEGITYLHQSVNCGKENCQRCNVTYGQFENPEKENLLHGPYWYAEFVKVGSFIVKGEHKNRLKIHKYIGKELRLINPDGSFQDPTKPKRKTP